jgi:TetR/AcrR family transcriptional regulator
VERRSVDTREKILEVAEQEFARDGFAGAHLQRIAGQVGVQKTALYYYFPSKAALYEAVLARMLSTFDASVREALDGPGAPDERLDRLLTTINDVLAEHRTYALILIRIFVDRVEMPGETLPGLIEGLVGRLMVFFREGADAGVFVRCSARHTLQSLLGAAVFHYASGSFGAAVLGVDDIYTRGAVTWRRDELRGFVRRALLCDPEGRAGGGPCQAGSGS